jgi:hypothetical protein
VTVRPGEARSYAADRHASQPDRPGRIRALAGPAQALTATTTRVSVGAAVAGQPSVAQRGSAPTGATWCLRAKRALDSRNESLEHVRIWPATLHLVSQTQRSDRHLDSFNA